LTEVVLAPLWVWLAYAEVPALLTLLGGGLVLAALVGRALSGMRRRTPPFGAV
jgi:drug/metabolite transporter (DMT)-like permease